MRPSAPGETLVLFRDSEIRRKALAAPFDDPIRYALYGADHLAARGHKVSIKTAQSVAYPRRYHWPGFLCDRLLRAKGWTSGHFDAALAHLNEIRQAEVVVSTVDSLGVPLLWLKRWRLFSTPLVYVSVGYPERIASMPADGQAAYRSLLRYASVILAFGFEEAFRLKEMLGWPRAERVRFIPFCAHDGLFSMPATSEEGGPDVLSVGADPKRDFELLLSAARCHAEWKFEFIVGRDRAKEMIEVPPNVRIEANLPFHETLVRMQKARVIALPVKENCYSGATTTLLQAMALGKPAIVSRVGAIRDGYGFRDGEHLRWIQPHDAEALNRALFELLRDADLRQKIGRRAREHVRQILSWARLVDGLESAIAQAREEANRP